MKKLARLIFILLLSPIVLFLSLVIISMSINSYTSHTFTKQLFTLPLPPKTQLLDKENYCGRLWNNSQGMEFTGVILIQSELSLDEIDEYYKNITFAIAKPNAPQSKEYPHGAVQLDVSLAKSSKYKPYFSDLYTFYFDIPQNATANFACYYISIHDDDYNSFFDFRGT